MKKIILSLIFLFNSSYSFAISTVDWMSTGDALITQDTVQNLEWLDLTVTQYMSFNEISNQSQAGGKFEGWRIAQVEEVQVLMTQFDIPIINLYTNHTFENQPQINEAISYLGLTGDDCVPVNTGGECATQGIVGRAYSSADGYLTTMSVLRDDLFGGEYYHLAGPWYETYVDSSTYAGNFMVRPTSVVPVPTAVWLFGSGLISLVSFARRNKSFSKHNKTFKNVRQTAAAF